MRSLKPSSNVTSAAFNNKTKDLKIIFHGGGKPGRAYLYKLDLPTYRRLTKVSSPGKFVWKNIRRAGIKGVAL